MTRYEQGFLNKCAEYGVDGRRLLVKTSTYKKWPKLNKEFKSLIRRVSNAYTGKTDLNKFDIEKAIRIMAKNESSRHNALWDDYIKLRTNTMPRIVTGTTARDRSFQLQHMLSLMTKSKEPVPELHFPDSPAGRDVGAAVEYISRRIADANKIID